MFEILISILATLAKTNKISELSKLEIFYNEITNKIFPVDVLLLLYTLKYISRNDDIIDTTKKKKEQTI